MFTRFRNFVSRHKKKFIVTGVIVGGTVLAVRFAQKKLQEFQEKQAKEFFENTRRLQYYELTERTCNQTIIELAAGINDKILRQLNTDHILTKLRQNPDNKIELWNELKIISFTKLTTLVYTSAILVITFRVQLNLLGGYIYKEMYEEDGNKLATADVQTQYLSLVQYFLKDGLTYLINVIQNNVEKILQRYNLKRTLSLADVQTLFWSIQMAINSEIDQFSQYILQKNEDLDDENNKFLTKIFNETFDLLESDEVMRLYSQHLSRGFTLVTDQIAEFYTIPKTDIPDNEKALVPVTPVGPSKESLNDESLVNINNIKIPLAKIIPIINGLTSNIGDVSHRQQSQQNQQQQPQNLATSLYTLFLNADKLKTLGANIYEAFCQ